MRDAARPANPNVEEIQELIQAVEQISDEPVDPHGPPLWLPKYPDRPGPPTEAVLAGFIVWLARQQLPPGRRRLYHRAVEEFLRWCEDNPDFHGGRPWGFYAELRGVGAAEARLRVTWEALAWLGSYLSGGQAEGAGPRHRGHGVDEP